MEEFKPLEQPKKKYIYRDNSTPKRKILFEREVEGGIGEADKLFEEETGINPRIGENGHIGCTIEEIESEN